MEDQESVFNKVLAIIDGVLKDPKATVESSEDYCSISGKEGKISKYKGGLFSVNDIYEVNNFTIKRRGEKADIEFKGNTYSIRSSVLTNMLDSFKHVYDIIRERSLLNSLKGKVVDFCDYMWDEECSHGSVYVIFTDGTALTVNGSYEEYGFFDFEVGVP